jgi:hypothetical protein
MLTMLVDTCVWLDMAKTPSQSKNLEILFTLCAEKEVALTQTVPQGDTRAVLGHAKNVGSKPTEGPSLYDRRRSEWIVAGP